MNTGMKNDEYYDLFGAKKPGGLVFLRQREGDIMSLITNLLEVVPDIDA